jgi:hypothetical protein
VTGASCGVKAGLNLKVVGDVVDADKDVPGTVLLGGHNIVMADFARLRQPEKAETVPVTPSKNISLA